MKTIGFIGLGTMGMPMVANLLKQGYPVTVYNRTAEKMEAARKLGAEAVFSPAEAARSCDVLMTMLGDDASLHEVYYGPDGVLDGVQPGMTIIDCTTVSPEMSRKLHDELKAKFVSFLDAPVTGSKPAAESGTLLFMVGGSKDVLEDHMDLFDTLGRKVLYMGPSGSGSKTKLAHNAMVGIHAAALAEGLAMAVRSGIDGRQFLEVVLAGNASSKQAELKGPKMLSGDFDNQFSLKLMLKDLNLASGMTGSLNVPSPVLQAARNVFQMGASKGLGELDLSAVVQCYEEWIGLPMSSRTAAPAGRAAGPSRPVDGAAQDRRRAARVPVNIRLRLSVYQWEQEGSFSGQTIEGTLFDISEGGLQIVSSFPLALDMFVVIHFPQDAELPPITGKVIRIENKDRQFHYGCMLSGIPPVIKKRLDAYIQKHQNR